MAEHYPELTLGEDPSSGLEALTGPLPLVTARSGIVRRIPLLIAFPPAYPDDEPRVFDHTGRFLPHDWSRHFYSEDGRCCLWLPWDSQWDGRSKDGMLDFMAHVAIFFGHQLLFDATTKWPIPAWGHGRDGYREFLVERLGVTEADFPNFIPLLLDGPRVAYLPCPCGSGKYAKRCHLRLVNELISRVGRSEVRGRVAWITEALTQNR